MSPHKSTRHMDALQVCVRCNGVEKPCLLCGGDRWITHFQAANYWMEQGKDTIPCPPPEHDE